MIRHLIDMGKETGLNGHKHNNCITQQERTERGDKELSSARSESLDFE